MNTVFAITHSDYDDYSVYGLYATREIAEEMRKRAQDNLNYSNLDIEEWSIQDTVSEPVMVYKYYGQIDKNGELHHGFIVNTVLQGFDSSTPGSDPIPEVSTVVHPQQYNGERPFFIYGTNKDAVDSALEDLKNSTS